MPENGGHRSVVCIVAAGGVRQSFSMGRCQRKKKYEVRVRELLEQQQIPTNHVHVMGTSMGAGSSLAYAIHRPDMIRSVCAVMPMTDLSKWVVENPGYAAPIAEAFGGTREEIPDVYDRNSAIRNVSAFADIPVMLVHGKIDTTVRCEHSQKLCELLHHNGSVCELCIVPDVAHKDEVMLRFQTKAADFFDAATN